jgi:hypothetical protein
VEGKSWSTSSRLRCSFWLYLKGGGKGARAKACEQGNIYKFKLLSQVDGRMPQKWCQKSIDETSSKPEFSPTRRTAGLPGSQVRRKSPSGLVPMYFFKMQRGS